jgi:hypothetical protein
MAFLFLRTFVASSLAVSIPRPIPEKEWMVTPPILHAAMPVEAVMATASNDLRCFSFMFLMISRRSTDLPVPKGLNQPPKAHTKGLTRTSAARIEDAASLFHQMQNLVLLVAKKYSGHFCSLTSARCDWRELDHVAPAGRGYA